MTALTPNDRFISLSPVAGTTVLAYDFELMLAEGMTVQRIRAGVTTTLVLGVDHSFPGGIGNETGGSLTLAVASLADDIYQLIGNQPEQRLSDFVASQRFDVVKMNADLDALTMVTQEHRRDIGRAVKAAYGSAGADLPAAEAGKVLGWNAAGDALENKTAADLGAVVVNDDVAMTGDSHQDPPSQHATKTYATTVAAAALAAANAAALQRSSNLSDVADAPTARKNLGVPVVVASKAAIAAMALATGVAASFAGNLWTFSASNLSSLVTADTRQAYYIAPASAPTGASGAWVKQRDNLDVNIVDFGATGDGATDDKAACQAALDWVKFQGGGVLRVPAASVFYKLSAGLTYDVSAAVGRFTQRLWVRGDGPASCFSMLTVAGTVLTVTGNASYVEMHAHFEGLRLTGNNTVGSKGLVLSKSAFGSSDGLIIEAFDYNLDCTDVEQTAFYNSNFRWGLHGVRFNAAAGTTSANSLLFVNCAIANNTTWGAWFTNPNAVKFVGGSIQYNGATGAGATNWGLKITESGDGYGTVVLDSVAMEGNGGDSDFIGEQTTNICTYAFLNCGFARPNNVSYATNFIKLDGTQAITLHMSGNTFRGYNTYVANAARPYLALNNTAVKIFDDGTNIYGSATERPGWGTFGLYVKRGVDINMFMSNGFTRATGVAIGAINDALTGLTPYEIRTSELLVSGLTGATAVRTVASYLKGSVVYDPPSLADGAGTTTTVTVTGAALGDIAQASHTQPLQGITVNAWVSAADTVSVRFQNESGGVLDLASGTLTAIVIRP